MWSLCDQDIKGLEQFQQTKLRRILCISWEEHITNNKVFSWTSLPIIKATILQHCLCWVGHMSRMYPTQLPYIILSGELASVKKLHGGTKWHFKDQLKASLSMLVCKGGELILVADKSIVYEELLDPNKTIITKVHCKALQLCSVVLHNYKVFLM